MKKFFSMILKVFIFLLILGIFIAYFSYVDSDDPAVFRFLSEADNLFFIAIETLLFWFIGRRKLQIIGWQKPVRNIIIGISAGLVWTLIPIVILVFMVYSFTDFRTPASLWTWIISMVAYTLWMELLVHGYVYQTIKKAYNALPAIILAAALFTLIYDGKSSTAGVVGLLSTFTMSLATSTAMEYTGSLITPFIMQFIFNLFNGIIVGTQTMITFPHILNAAYINSNPFLGSMVLTGANCILIVFFFVQKRDGGWSDL